MGPQGSFDIDGIQGVKEKSLTAQDQASNQTITKKLTF
jgi:hypothetical protein